MRCARRLHLGVLIASQRIRPTPRYELPGELAQLGHTRARSASRLDLPPGTDYTADWHRGRRVPCDRRRVCAVAP